MTPDAIQTMLAAHALWLRDESGTHANLQCANLQNANLQNANLRGANLQNANLRGADLQNADLRGADLQNAGLRYASLQNADLQDANLRGADLQNASLQNADLQGAKLPGFQIPQEGELIVYKALRGCIAKLRVPPEAKRTASLAGRKCRAEFVEVLAGEGYDKHRGATLYEVGAVVRPDKYDDDPRIECTHGIHFFLTREEAESWL